MAKRPLRGIPSRIPASCRSIYRTEVIVNGKSSECIQVSSLSPPASHSFHAVEDFLIRGSLDESCLYFLLHQYSNAAAHLRASLCGTPLEISLMNWKRVAVRGDMLAGTWPMTTFSFVKRRKTLCRDVSERVSAMSTERVGLRTCPRSASNVALFPAFLLAHEDHRLNGVTYFNSMRNVR